MTVRSTPCHVLVERTIDRRPDGNRSEIRAFAKCRNERLRLPAFLNHYRALGVDRFFVVDHDSSDGTTDYLAAQPDVDLFRTHGRFREAAGGTAWLNALLMEFGVGRWCVTVDIDEWLMFPGSEQMSLRTFTEHLDRHGFDTFSCLLLDLYPAGPLRECGYKAGDDPLAAAPYFDVGPYTISPYDLCPGVVIRGGVRERIFYPERREQTLGVKTHDAIVNLLDRMPLLRDSAWMATLRRPSPCLTKVPLVRWNAQTRYLASTHFISRGNVAPERGVLLHFKLLQDFHERAIHEAARREYHDHAVEYRRYLDTLRKNPDIALVDERSAKFENTAQLIRLGLMRDSDAWAAARTT